MSDAELIGADLRAAREERDLSLVQAEQATRIRIYYLEALETGRFEILPSPVQGRGFLKNYARYLGLDSDPLIVRFDAAINGANRRSRFKTPQSAPAVLSDPAPRKNSPRTTIPAPDSTPVPTAPRTTRTRTPPASGAVARQRRSRNTALITLLIAVISLIGLVVLLTLAVQGASQNNDTGILSTQPTLQPSATPTLDASATAMRPSPLPNPNTPAAVAPAAGSVNVQITVRARTTLKVFADGAQVYSGVPGPDTVLQYQGKQEIRIECGNAAAIDVNVNGVQQGELGQNKQAINRTFTAGGSTSVPVADAPVNSTLAPTRTTESAPTLASVTASQPTSAPTAAQKIVQPTKTPPLVVPTRPIATATQIGAAALPASRASTAIAAPPTIAPATTRAPTVGFTMTATYAGVNFPRATATQDIRPN